MTRKIVRISSGSGIPLIGSIAFGLIDRGTNLIQIRPISTCPLSCIFCSTDAGPRSKRRAEYIVDEEYLIGEFERLVEFKGDNDIEAHIDTVGDPLTYRDLPKLVRDLREIPEVKVISIQTHGVLLTENLIKNLEKAGVDRINLSIDSLNEEKARYLSGSQWLKIDRIIKAARMIADSSMDLLIAPVWVPTVNDEDIPRIIDFALSIGAGKRWPPLGIQKYELYRRGRNAGVKPMPWKKFYSALKRWEEEFGVKLILRPEDFGIHHSRQLKAPFSIGETAYVEIVAPGMRANEALGKARGRAINVVNASNIPIGARVRIRVIRNRDNIIVGVPIYSSE
ncbi:MAG: radical SAM protein [Thermoproteota archaeon]|nr:MAG: radical SAM protein [Candidatus Korarchaeota archaeon]